MDSYSLDSGLKLNIKKRNVLKSGSLRNSNIHYCDDKKFQWKSDSVKALGMFFYNDSQLTNSNNVNDCKNCLKQSMHRKLTLMGKIIVVKSFALPKLIYPLTVLKNISSEKIKEINKLMFNLYGIKNLTKSPEKYYVKIITMVALK